MSKRTFVTKASMRLHDDEDGYRRRYSRFDETEVMGKIAGIMITICDPGKDYPLLHDGQNSYYFITCCTETEYQRFKDVIKDRYSELIRFEFDI